MDRNRRHSGVCMLLVPKHDLGGIRGLHCEAKKQRQNKDWRGNYSFNAKHQYWGSAINDAKGDALSEMIHAIGFIACNTGRKPTFQRGASESIIDITFASPKLAT